MLLRGLASATSGMEALIEKNDSIANNIANVNTTGYKKERLIFQDMFDTNIVQKTGNGQNAEVQTIGSLSMGSQVSKLTYDFSQGALSKTGSPFDLAIEGDGFFKVQDSNGQISYTRNGSFTLNNGSYLVTKDGDYVLDQNSQRVRINTNGMKMRSNNDIMVGESGLIQINNGTNPTSMQTVGIFDFQNKEDMINVGASKFRPTNPATNREVKAQKYVIQQGSLEMSNSNIVNEMINTINTSRNYEALSKMVKAGSDSLSTALRVGRLS